MELYDLLENATSDKPVCRFEYQLRTGKPERQFRLEVEEMRKQGIRVVSSNGHGGYWIAKSAAEYITFRNQQMSRVKSILETVKAMDGNLLGQEDMSDALLL
jgi:hypothetical protein